MISKKEKARRRASRNRFNLKKSSKNHIRLSVFRSINNIYAQIIDDSKGFTLISCSTMQKDIKAKVKNGSNIEAAKLVGKEVAKLALDKGIKEVSFDRGAYLYHGRVQALSEAARENGLKF